MNRRQLEHLKTEMEAINTCGAVNNYKRKRLGPQKRIYYKHEHDNITGEWLQSYMPEQIKDKII